jgi:hypothetical protein
LAPQLELRSFPEVEVPSPANLDRLGDPKSGVREELEEEPSATVELVESTGELRARHRFGGLVRGFDRLSYRDAHTGCGL